MNEKLKEYEKAWLICCGLFSQNRLKEEGEMKSKANPLQGFAFLDR
jgi:hypothetical protein